MPKMSSIVTVLDSRSIWSLMVARYSGLENQLARNVPVMTTTRIATATFHRFRTTFQ
jgi:hypothetical protein